MKIITAVFAVVILSAACADQGLAGMAPPMEVRLAHLKYISCLIQAARKLEPLEPDDSGEALFALCDQDLAHLIDVELRHFHEPTKDKLAENIKSSGLALSKLILSAQRGGRFD